MSLKKKMILGVLTGLLIIFIGTYLITLNFSRNYFIQQLESNAQDTATSLGLSLSHALGANDKAMMLAMVEAVFDRGYFSRVEVRDMNDKVIASRVAKFENNVVPHWFIRLIHWPETAQSALVMSGWRQVGKVVVVSNNHYAYVALWNNALGLVNWYLVFVLVSLVLIYVFVRSLLKPLHRLTQQALAISGHEFPIEKQLPKTPELRQVTLAMNQMVAKIKALFTEQREQTEALRSQVYQDTLTGLSNRRYFLQQLSALLESEDEFIPGYVMMVVIDELDEFNHQYGYQRGDELVLAVAKACKDYWKFTTVSTLARLNGSTFGLIIHERDARLFDEQCRAFEQILKQVISGLPICLINMGAVPYFLHQTTSNLLSMVDLAVKSARETGLFYCQRAQETVKYPTALGVEDLQSALDDQRLKLYSQPVTDGKNCLHKEVFTRLIDRDGQELGAGFFMPLAEKYELAHQLDLYVLQAIGKLEVDGHLPCPLAVNISKDTLLHKDYQQAYLQALTALPLSLRQDLQVELSESYIIEYFASVKPFVSEIRKLGLKVGVDRAGIHFSPLHYLSDLTIDYIKLHGSLVQDIDDNQSKQFFIHYFNRMAQTMDIAVIATQIEHQVQWKALQDIHVLWGQGRYLSEIEAL